MRIPTTRLTFCAVACSLAVGCAGSAGPKLSAVDRGFLGGIASYDKDNNDVVTCDEWRVAAENLFGRADKAGKGSLAEREFQNLATIDRTFQVASFKYFDTNGDGKVEKKEFVERPNPAFTYADKDKDCRLTSLELQTARGLSAPRQTTTPTSTNPVSATGPRPSGGSSY